MVAFVEEGHSNRSAAARVPGGRTLGHGRRHEPRVVDLHVQSQLVPTLQQGDAIILDNLAAHPSPAAAAAMKAVGAWFLFLPVCSPDLNPMEMAFAKLKALIRRAAARTYDDVWRAVGHVCDLFTDEACHNFFKAAGYEAD